MSEVYAGLDVSDKQTHICLVDATGAVVWRGRCATDPDVIAKLLAKRAAALSVSCLMRRIRVRSDRPIGGKLRTSSAHDCVVHSAPRSTPPTDLSEPVAQPAFAAVILQAAATAP